MEKFIKEKNGKKRKQKLNAKKRNKKDQNNKKKKDEKITIRYEQKDKIKKWKER